MMIQYSVGASDAATPFHEEQWPFWRYFLIIGVAAVAVIGVDLLDGISFVRDVDDVLREMQIRRLVEGAAWFDLSLPSVQMPETYILPWSRLVDLPYALITWALTPVMGQELALASAFKLWPPVLGVLYLLTLLGCLRRVAPGSKDLPITLLLTMPVFAIYSIWEFSPDRIDHHNVQIVLMTLIFYGVLRWDRLGGLIIGAASSLSVAVGLETLPVLMAVLGALSLAWLMDCVGSGVVLRWTGAACASLTLLLMVALIEPSRYLRAENDSFSAPYAAAMIGFGLVATISTGARSAGLARGGRNVAFLCAYFVLVAMIISVYPAMLEGPMPMLKGLAKTYWFDRINFEQSVFSLLSFDDVRSVLQYFVVFAVLACSFPSVMQAIRRGEPAVPVAFFAIVASVMMACVSLRFFENFPWRRRHPSTRRFGLFQKRRASWHRS